MKFLSIVGNSFGCSASGERLVSAARDGDLLEARALLEYNPRLARYSTFGVRNSPLHYSAAQGHHEIVSLLLESGVEINLRNYRGQNWENPPANGPRLLARMVNSACWRCHCNQHRTALMQACQHGHWEVVQILVLFKANIHRADYLNGGTALHLGALNGHSRCIRLLLADYIPSVPDFWNILRKRSDNKESTSKFDYSALCEVINKPADGGITALHMAALNGHVETVQLLLDLGACVSNITVKDGTTIDLIGAGSTALHYAACGGNAQCCQMLVSRGASLDAENENGWTPLMVARSWHRDCLEEILSTIPEEQSNVLPSPYLSLPLMSIVKIARDCGWKSNDCVLTCQDPCVVCLERKCTVAAEGCDHEFCTHCALYLCSTNSTSTTSHGPPGSIACPLCRNGIVSFIRLPETRPTTKDIAKASLSLSFCACSREPLESTSLTTPFCKPELRCTRVSSGGASLRSIGCQRLSSMKISSSRCMGCSDISPCLVPRNGDHNLRNHLARCSGSEFRRTASHSEARRSSWFSTLNQYVTTSSGC